MLQNYFKLALRDLWKNKIYSSINVFGLAIGIASFCFILLYVNDEKRFDAFHEKSDNLYRISTFESDDGVERFIGNSYYPLTTALEATLPKNSKLARFFPYSISVKNLRTNNSAQEQAFYFADSTFFDLFSFEFIAGDPATALRASNQLVINASTAERLFGEENPIGQALRLEDKVEFMVAGVVADPPKNSSIQFDFIAPLPSVNTLIYDGFFSPRSWYYPALYTFAYVPDPAFIRDWESYQASWKKQNLSERIGERYTFHFQPIRDMHFTALENDLAPSVQSSFLWILVGIAFLILGIACINYINLALTRMIKRYPEIGVRKVLGAVNSQILTQMSSEAFLTVSLALLISMGLINFSLPYFNELTDKELMLFSTQTTPVWTAIGLSLISITFIIALFPYWGLKRFKIISILKGKIEGKLTTKRRVSIKDSLVVAQFVSAIGLIIATMIIQYQLNYINTKDIGFSPEQVLIVPIRDGEVQNNYKTIKNNLLAESGVIGVSAISNFPWENGFYDFPSVINDGQQDREVNLPTLMVDEDFIKVMDIRIKEGRAFSEDYGTEKSSAFIFNEAATESFALDDITQASVTMSSVADDEDKVGQIVGVAENFHFKSLHNPIDPLVLTVAPVNYFIDNFVVRVSSNNLPATIASLGNTWEKMVPGRPFDYFFLDDAFNQLYLKESRMGKIFKSFTILALFIAFLGLLALSALSAEQRTKEIGIRKVLGASVMSIITLLSKDYLKLVVLALIIASPLAWYAMQQWLENFAYHVPIKWWMFVAAGMTAVMLAILTISLQSLKAAGANPVDSLRDE